jgi:glycosyltransferase involved in cell wall biosynthesis
MPSILHLDDAMSWRGGQQQVLSLHEGLLVAGLDSRVVCQAGGALESRLRAARLPHYALRMHGGHDLVAARRIGRLWRREAALLHAHTSHAHDLALWASRLCGRMPLVVSRRVDFRIDGSWWRRRKYRDRRVDRYLAISSAVEQELLRGGVEPERIRRVPSGIDLSRFDHLTPDGRFRASLGVGEDELLFCNVAALAPHKDQQTLLAAFADYRRSGGSGHLIILGEGELRAALLHRRRELELDACVHLPGFVDDVLPKLASCDVFVLSSRTEGLGTSILDAMALGRCVVATRAGGIPDAIEDGETGLLVAAAAPLELAAALKRVAQDEPLRRRLGDRARAAVREFDVQLTVARTHAVYAELWNGAS